MARVKFKIAELGGGDLAEARRIFGPHWEILKYCEASGLYKREAEVLIWHVMGCTNTQISQVTGVELTHVRKTLKRAVERIARQNPPKHVSTVVQAWALINAFRNRKSWADHGPQLSGTRQGGYREVTRPQLVIAEDLVREEDPLMDSLLRRLRID